MRDNFTVDYPNEQQYAHSCTHLIQLESHLALSTFHCDGISVTLTPFVFCLTDTEFNFGCEALLCRECRSIRR